MLYFSINHMSKLLTKSKYIIGLQCTGYLWDSIHNKNKIPQPDKSSQYRMDQGTIVGQLATKYFPEGIAIPEGNFMENLNQSKKLLSKRVPLFEAAFMVDGIYSRADILKPVGKTQWDIIEVKSGTKVKPENLHDVSFQKHCYEKAGLKIRKCFLMNIDNTYVKKGKIDPKKIFKLTDITNNVTDISKGLAQRIKVLLQIINSTTRPKVPISHDCKTPYDCPLKHECWSFLPVGNVFELYYGGKKSFDLYEQGVVLIKEIPDDFKLSDKQIIQHKCEKDCKSHMCKDSIKKFVGKLQYPLYYLDFETINPVLPLFDGMKPYQRISFQFSLHIVQEDGSTEHISFLAEGKTDPRPKFVKELKKVLGSSGSIIVYNQSFEQGVLRELAEAFPNYSDWVTSLTPRFVDLIVPFRKFHYYSPTQKGSYSIKKVLPAVTGKSYDGMEIGNGADASISFIEAEYSDCSVTKRKKIRTALEKYCGLDTEGMVWIINELNKLSRTQRG
jgi:hypothetical protein